MNKKTFGLKNHKCKTCGKQFECGLEYAYKKPKTRKESGSYYYFCSWSCLRKDEKNA